jgi:hypothetical protein
VLELQSLWVEKSQEDLKELVTHFPESKLQIKTSKLTKSIESFNLFFI